MNSPALQVSGSARTTADRLHKNANPTMKDQSLYCGGKPSNRPEKIESIPATIRAVPTEIPSVDSQSMNTGLFSVFIKLPAFTVFNSPPAQIKHLCTGKVKQTHDAGTQHARNSLTIQDTHNASMDAYGRMLPSAACVRRHKACPTASYYVGREFCAMADASVSDDLRTPTSAAAMFSSRGASTTD